MCVCVCLPLVCVCVYPFFQPVLPSSGVFSLSPAWPADPPVESEAEQLQLVHLPCARGQSSLRRKSLRMTLERHRRFKKTFILSGFWKKNTK